MEDRLKDRIAIVTGAGRGIRRGEAMFDRDYYAHVRKFLESYWPEDSESPEFNVWSAIAIRARGARHWSGRFASRIANWFWDIGLSWASTIQRATKLSRRMAAQTSGSMPQPIRQRTRSNLQRRPEQESPSDDSEDGLWPPAHLSISDTHPHGSAVLLKFIRIIDPGRTISVSVSGFSC